MLENNKDWTIKIILFDLKSNIFITSNNKDIKIEKFNKRFILSIEITIIFIDKISLFLILLKEQRKLINIKKNFIWKEKKRE